MSARAAIADQGGFSVAEIVIAATISPSTVDCWDGTGTQGTAGACPSSTFYNSSNHRLTVTAGLSLTLGGGDYIFCSVSVATGATLQTSLTASAHTRIFIDNPNGADCGGSSGDLTLNGNLNSATDVITQDLNLFNMPLSAGVGVFTQKQYVQCAGYEPPVATPTKDC